MRDRFPRRGDSRTKIRDWRRVCTGEDRFIIWTVNVTPLFLLRGATMAEPHRKPQVQRSTTGVPGLDDILNGGLPSYRLYLVDGDPGAGKTTLALQFLLEGVKAGEK